MWPLARSITTVALKARLKMHAPGRKCSATFELGEASASFRVFCAPPLPLTKFSYQTNAARGERERAESRLARFRLPRAIAPVENISAQLRHVPSARCPLPLLESRKYQCAALSRVIRFRHKLTILLYSVRRVAKSRFCSLAARRFSAYLIAPRVGKRARRQRIRAAAAARFEKLHLQADVAGNTSASRDNGR